MLYDLHTMPRNEIHHLLIDLHEQKTALQHEIIELKMQNERLVRENDRLGEPNG